MNPKFLLLALIICQTIFFSRSKNDSITTKKINYKELIILQYLLAILIGIESDAIKI
jgi:hypothetical protein